MDLSLRQIFDRARAAQEWVPPSEAELLFAVALRLAVEQATPLAASRIILHEGGVLELTVDEHAEDPADERTLVLGEGEGARPGVDGPAEVYAAGAIGYELFTGLPPPRPPAGPGPELTGPLGDVVRVAMARDRRERFADLRQLLDAVTAIETRRSAPEERGLLAALLARVKRWEERAQNAAALAVLRHETETLEARLSQQEALTDQLAGLAGAAERIAILETALQAVRTEFATGLVRQQQNLRELVEDRRREEAKARERDEQREAHAALHPPRVRMLPVIGAAVVAAAASAIVSVLVLDRVLSSGESAPIARAVAPPAVAVQAPSPVREPAQPTAPTAAVAAAPATPAAPAAATAVPAATELPTAPGVGAPTAEPVPSAPAAPSPAKAASGSAAAPIAVATPNAPIPPAATAAPPAAYLPASAEPATAPVAAKASPPAGPAIAPRKRARQLLDRGDLSLEKGHADAAVTAFHGALEADPTLAEAHRGLGMAFALQGNDAVAKLEYERYLAASPQAPDATEIRAAINELNARSNLGESH